MICGHCERPLKTTIAVHVCPYQAQDATGHSHAVCFECVGRMTADAPEEPTVNKIDRAAVLHWFTGKALTDASWALDRLEDCEKIGAWIPKVSRSVRAALGKANVAAKLGRAHHAGLEAIGDYSVPRERRGWTVMMLLLHSSYNAPVDFTAVRAATEDIDLHAVIDKAEAFRNALAPAFALMDRLDATRPIPTITYLGASPTVTALLQSLGLTANVSTIRVCPVKWTRVEKDGKYHFVGRLDWPKGTIHNASRYSRTHDNSQCQACGHAIKNPFNWVPMLVDGVTGTPHSLWVGTDCARTLFGVKVTGPMELAQGEL